MNQYLMDIKNGNLERMHKIKFHQLIKYFSSINRTNNPQFIAKHEEYFWILAPSAPPSSTPSACPSTAANRSGLGFVCKASRLHRNSQNNFAVELRRRITGVAPYSTRWGSSAHDPPTYQHPKTTIYTRTRCSISIQLRTVVTLCECSEELNSTITARPLPISGFKKPWKCFAAPTRTETFLPESLDTSRSRRQQRPSSHRQHFFVEFNSFFAKVAVVIQRCDGSWSRWKAFASF